jgi:hypothetical protein
MKTSKQLITTCGFTDKKESFITKKNLEFGLESLDKKLLDNLCEEYGYSVKDRVNRGINNTQQLLCLLRRVIRRDNKFIVYKRFKEDKITKYKYFIV